MATEKYYGTGRRKSSIARVYVMPGKGNITINKRSIDEYFGLDTLKVIVRQPLNAIDALDKFDVIVSVHGGGFFYSIQQHLDESDLFYDFNRFLFCGVCDVVALFYRSVRHIDDYYFDNACHLYFGL